MTNFTGTDLDKITGITNGTAIANKCVVTNATIDVTGLRNVTATGTLGVTGLITASSGLTISNKVTTNQSLIWHISPFDFTYAVAGGVIYSSTSGCCYSSTTDDTIYAPFTVPYKMFGGTVVLDQITVYGYTAAAGSDTISTYLKKTDQDNTITQVDNGSGTATGLVNFTLLSADIAMTDYAYWIYNTFSNAAADSTTTRIFDIKVEAHLE